MIIPLGHRLLVKPDKIEEVDRVYAAAKAAGLEIPELSKRQEQNAIDKGEVISIGSTAFNDFGGTPWCAVGDKVVYARYGGKLLTDPETGNDFILLNDEDILAKISIQET